MSLYRGIHDVYALIHNTVLTVFDFQAGVPGIFYWCAYHRKVFYPLCFLGHQRVAHTGKTTERPGRPVYHVYTGHKAHTAELLAATIGVGSCHPVGTGGGR